VNSPPKTSHPFKTSILQHLTVLLLTLWSFSCADSSPERTNNDTINKSQSIPVHSAVSTSQLTECPAKACVVGTTGCNYDGTLIPCVQDPNASEGCGYYDTLQFQSCGVDSFCYRGLCISQDEIELHAPVRNVSCWKSCECHLRRRWCSWRRQRVHFRSASGQAPPVMPHTLASRVAPWPEVPRLAMG